MKNNDFLNDLLLLYSNITAILNTSKKNVEIVYNKNIIIAKQISYEEFAQLFMEQKNLDTVSKNKFLRFINNLNTSSEPFAQNATFTSKQGDKILFKVRGLKYEESNTLLTIGDYNVDVYESQDSLTKVLSRETIINKIKAAIRKKEDFALMIIDIDNFKIFNDTYGHMFGDIILVETAVSIKKHLCDKGYVGRIGGDEFLVLAYIENNYDKIHTVCRSIRQAITTISTHNIKQALITATIGCAYYPKDATDYDTLFKKADLALYRGKKKGRNCFVIYDEAKCGKISDHQQITEPNVELYQTSINANIVAGIFEMLNREGSNQKNIDDALSLIGNYFLLDRITLVSIDPKNEEVRQTTQWNNTKVEASLTQVIPAKRNYPIWRKSYDGTGMLKIVQVNSTIENDELKHLLLKQNTSAILAFELRYMKQVFGLIRYDMCSINRFWQQTEISALMLISKIFAIYLNNQYEKQQHYTELYFDKQTNIFNYYKWRIDVSNYLEEHKTQEYSLISIRISDFINMQDIYGTSYCDAALKNIANGLLKVYTDKGIFCRVDQDKFMIFIPTNSKKKIETGFTKLVQYIETKTKTKGRFKICAGAYIHQGNDSISTAIDRSTLTRKQITSPSKSTLLYFSNDLFESLKRKTKYELHMHQALEDNEFLIYLQPKFNIDTKQMIGAEALTRWNFEHKQILSPMDYIPLFEANGFITELDYWVFERVCQILKENKGFYPDDFKISVNVSRAQNDFNLYIQSINKIREGYDISAAQFEIEITENMFTDKENEIKEFIDNLHSYGYSVSMDDFGQGYSNLSSISSLDFDIVKLDKKFMKNFKDPKKEIILSSIIKLIQKLGMSIICEGVETKEYEQHLKNIGCHHVQGYLYDPPLPQQQFIEKYFRK